MSDWNSWENDPWSDTPQQDDWANTPASSADSSDWALPGGADSEDLQPKPAGGRTVGRTRRDHVRQVPSPLEIPKNVYMGIAQDLQSSPNMRSGFFSRWISSLIYGVPLCLGRSAATRNVFNLATHEIVDSVDMGAQRSVAVTFFGDSNTGLIGRGQTMEVHGKKGPDGSVYAESILNRTNGTRIQFDSGISGNVVRVLTLMLVMALVAIGLDAVPGVSGLRSWVSSVDWGGLLLGAVLVGAALIWLINSLRRPTPGTMKILGIVILVGLCVLVPDLGASVLVLVLMIVGIGYLLKSIF